jgi:hypothetical protein
MQTTLYVLSEPRVREHYINPTLLKRLEEQRLGLRKNVKRPYAKKCKELVEALKLGDVREVFIVDTNEDHGPTTVEDLLIGAKDVADHDNRARPYRVGGTIIQGEGEDFHYLANKEELLESIDEYVERNSGHQFLLLVRPAVADFILSILEGRYITQDLTLKPAGIISFKKELGLVKG